MLHKFITLLVVMLAMLTGCVESSKTLSVFEAQRQQSLVIERGGQLIQIMGCNSCHTPDYIVKRSNIPEEDWLVGGTLGFRGPQGTSYPTNLRLLLNNMSEEDWDKTMAVNLKGVFLVSKYAIPEMRKVGGGVIVHNASSAALKGVKDRGAYSASKGGVLALTKAMAADYIGENIRVNCVCPGTTDTPSLESRIRAFADPEKARKDFIDRQPMKRLGKAEEIAAAILFAASDEAAFMNGTIIAIDGGMTI